MPASGVIALVGLVAFMAMQRRRNNAAVVSYRFEGKHESAVMAPSGVDATTSIRLAWSAHATASIVTSFELPERQFLHVAGTAGALAVGQPFTPGPADTTFTITRPNGSVETHETAGGNCYEAMIDAFAAAVRGRAAWPRPTSEVLALTGLCEMIAAAASTG